MTTVYQIGTSTFLTKDLVFGWVLIHNDQELDVVSTMSKTTAGMCMLRLFQVWIRTP